MAEQPQFRQEILVRWWNLEKVSTNKTIHMLRKSVTEEHGT